MSNFKNTVYSILNEAPEDRNTRIAREKADAEVRRKAEFERAQAKRKAEIDNPRNSEGSPVAKRTQDLKRRQAEAEAEEKFRRTLRGEGSEKQPESSSKPTPSATPPSTPSTPSTPPPSTPSTPPPSTPSTPPPPSTPSTPSTPPPSTPSTPSTPPSTPSRPQGVVANNSSDSDDKRLRQDIDAVFDDQSTSSSLTSRINNIQNAKRGSTASAIAAYTQSQTDKRNASRAMQTAGYSYNKALTFFAEQLKRKYIEEEVVNPENQPMTKSEISHRDKIRHKSPAKDARIVKSADKTKENAEYRLATYITMRGRKGKKKENK